MEFIGALPEYLYKSPSLTYGIILLVPLVLLIGEAISAPRGSTGFGGWVLIALFMIGASDAKVIILPMLGLSLALVGAGHLLLRRRVVPAVPIAGAMALVVFAVAYVAEYRGHSTGIQLDLTAGRWFFNDAMGAVRISRSYIEGSTASFTGRSVLLSGAGVALGAFGLYGAQLVGIPWVLARQRLRPTTRQAWLLAFLITGVTLPLVSRSPGTSNQFYFFSYGLLIGSILSADGLRQLWASRPELTGVARQRAVVVGVMGVGVFGVATILPAQLWSEQEFDRAGTEGALGLRVAARRLGPPRGVREPMVPGREVGRAERHVGPARGGRSRRAPHHPRKGRGRSGRRGRDRPAGHPRAVRRDGVDPASTRRATP